MEIKQEIAQIVSKLPNEVLGELLQYLRYVEKIHTGENSAFAKLKYDFNRGSGSA